MDIAEKDCKLKNIQDANEMMNVLSEIGLKIMEMHLTLNDYQYH